MEIELKSISSSNSGPEDIAWQIVREYLLEKCPDKNLEEFPHVNKMTFDGMPFRIRVLFEWVNSSDRFSIAKKPAFGQFFMTCSFVPTIWTDSGIRELPENSDRTVLGTGISFTDALFSGIERWLHVYGTELVDLLSAKEPGPMSSPETDPDTECASEQTAEYYLEQIRKSLRVKPENWFERSVNELFHALHFRFKVGCLLFFTCLTVYILFLVSSMIMSTFS